jgi:hypothetical protein
VAKLTAPVPPEVSSWSVKAELAAGAVLPEVGVIWVIAVALTVSE